MRFRFRGPLYQRATIVVPACLVLALSANALDIDPAAPSRNADQLAPLNQTQAAIEKAFAHMEADETSEAIEAFDTAIQSSGFQELPEDRKYIALETDGEAVEKQGDHAKAYALFARATNSSETGEAAWHNRLATAYELNDFVDSAHSVATIARRWPDSLKKIRATAISVVEERLGDDERADIARFEMLDALFDANWNDEVYDTSVLWRELTRILLARQDISRAKLVAARVQDTHAALSMRIDKRFDIVTAANPRFDIDRLAAANLTQARQDSANAPDQLRLRVLLMSRLLDSMRYEETLRLANQVVAIARDGGGSANFKDFDDQYNWILDYRERALLRLGRVREAVREMERAARRPEHGELNVSQIINLGTLYDALGRPADALDTVWEVGTMSPYGRMQLEFVRLWACIQERDVAAVTKHMAFMREHRADAMDTWNDALVLDGKTDAAARQLIERLRSERWRTDALASMQRYGKVRRPHLEQILRNQWRRICARPGVRAALRSFGRVETYRLEPAET